MRVRCSPALAGHRHHRCVDVHDLVALAPQQAQLLSGSVLDNVALGRSNTATSDAAGARARAQKALERADADEFVRAMGGLDAPVGESGSALSGGQRARVGVARALYRTLARGDGQGGAPADAGDDNTARLVVLDEPTAALDGASQSRLINETVRTCKESGTAILVRLARHVVAPCARACWQAAVSRDTDRALRAACGPPPRSRHVLRPRAVPGRRAGGGERHADRARPGQGWAFLRGAAQRGRAQHRLVSTSAAHSQCTTSSCNISHCTLRPASARAAQPAPRMMRAVLTSWSEAPLHLLLRLGAGPRHF